jgi:hypothetical protein
LAKNLTGTNVTIASSGTISTSIIMQANRVPQAIVFPAAMTGTAVTFQASFDDVTYTPVYDEATLYSINIGTSRHVGLKRQAMEGVKYFKIVSGTAETASRTILVISGE